MACCFGAAGGAVDAERVLLVTHSLTRSLSAALCCAPPPPPPVSCRPSANVRGSVGLPTPGTQVVVVDPTTHSRLPDGQQGLLLAAGPGVMAGYWRDAGATRKAFVDGWFNTGE